MKRATRESEQLCKVSIYRVLNIFRISSVICGAESSRIEQLGLIFRPILTNSPKLGELVSIGLSK